MLEISLKTKNDNFCYSKIINENLFILYNYWFGFLLTVKKKIKNMYKILYKLISLKKIQLYFFLLKYLV